MERNYRQTLDLFYIFLLRIKERIINKRPEILNFLVSNKFNIKRDPFGKYIRMINYIGERINPTGKKQVKEALKAGNLDYLLQEGIRQKEAGAHVLDVNVGLPDIDEIEMLPRISRELQEILDIPLQFDSSNIEALEKACRYYNGKPIINSVNGKTSSMEKLFPIAKKYGIAEIKEIKVNQQIKGNRKWNIVIFDKNDRKDVYFFQFIGDEELFHLKKEFGDLISNK